MIYIPSMNRDIEHQGADACFREVLLCILAELNVLCHRHQPQRDVACGDETEVGGAAAFRFNQFVGLAEWLERQMEEHPLDGDAIRRRQMELSSFLAWCDRKDLLSPLLSALSTSEEETTEHGAPAAPILSTIEHCAWGASDVLRLSSSQPHILHYLILQARHHDAAQEAWQQLKKHEEYLSADILIHIILNSGFREVVQDAWVLVRGREDLSRRHFESLARSAPFPQIREQAQSLIER